MNVSNLELILVQKISNSTSTLDTLIYSKALQELKTGSITVINTTADLPNPNTAFVGHLFYEKTTEAMYIVDSQGFARKLIAETSNIFTWGPNGNGRLGDGTTNSRNSPGTVAGLGSYWCAIRAASDNGGGIKTDGTLWVWGANNNSRYLDGTPITRSSPVTVIGGGTTWCALSTGYSSAAIKTDGTLWTWGWNGCGQLGDGTTTLRSSPATVAGGGTNWCQVCSTNYSAGASAAIKTDGTLWTWGKNSVYTVTGTRSSPDTIVGGGTNWCQVSMGGQHAAAVKTDGTLWVWGCNGYGQLGDGTINAQTSPITTAGGGTTWCAVSVSSTSSYPMTAAIKTDGTLWTWGHNILGALGTGNTTSRRSPGTVAGGGTTWCRVYVDGQSAIAVKTDGTLWTWGWNGAGQLGDGTTTQRCSPGTTLGGGTTWRNAQIESFAVGIKDISGS